MADIYADLSALMAAVEAELQTLQLWDVTPPAPEKLASELPFCVDTLAFYQWLQWVFLPKMQALIKYQYPLPLACAIHPAAIIAIGSEHQMLPLLAQLQAIDKLITASKI